jgi:enoyl-CoA hydratase/carnithine racemase
MTSELKTQRHGSTLILTISGPETRNTLSEQVISAGIEALNVAESDSEICAVVLRGDGTHFCAGGNLQGLRERRAAGPDAQKQMLERLHQFVEALRAFPKPVLAAVEGAAAGAGFSLALACDMIVAAHSARFTLSYARLGLTPDAGASWHLARALPRQQLQQMMWLAEPATAQQLHALGLVGFVVEDGQALAQALQLAQRLESMAPNALASGKELTQAAMTNDLTQHLAAERDHFIDNLFHPNAGEGLQAFFDKRAPRFR